MFLHSYGRADSLFLSNVVSPSVERVKPEMKPKMNTSISNGDDCYEKTFFMLLLLKLIFNVWEIRGSVFLKLLLVESYRRKFVGNWIWSMVV